MWIFCGCFDEVVFECVVCECSVREIGGIFCDGWVVCCFVESLFWVIILSVEVSEG